MFVRHRSDPQLTRLDELSLIRRYRQSAEHRYYNELYNRYVHLVFGSCLKHLKDRSQAKDMCMLIFEKLIDKLQREPIDNFQSWLFYFARNECISQLRKQEVEANREEEWKKAKKSEENFMENEALSRPYTDKDDSKISSAALQQAIKTLSKAQQRCIRLFFFEQLSYKQIAAKTQFSVKEVKSYLQNGKRNLRLALEAQMP